MSVAQRAGIVFGGILVLTGLAYWGGERRWEADLREGIVGETVRAPRPNTTESAICYRLATGGATAGSSYRVLLLQAGEQPVEHVTRATLWSSYSVAPLSLSWRGGDTLVVSVDSRSRRAYAEMIRTKSVRGATAVTRWDSFEAKPRAAELSP